MLKNLYIESYPSYFTSFIQDGRTIGLLESAISNDERDFQTALALAVNVTVDDLPIKDKMDALTEYYSVINQGKQDQASGGFEVYYVPTFLGQLIYFFAQRIMQCEIGIFLSLIIRCQKPTTTTTTTVAPTTTTATTTTTTTRAPTCNTFSINNQENDEYINRLNLMNDEIFLVCDCCVFDSVDPNYPGQIGIRSPNYPNDYGNNWIVRFESVPISFPSPSRSPL